MLDFPKYYNLRNTAVDQIDNVQCTGTEPKLTNCFHTIANPESYRSPRVDCELESKYYAHYIMYIKLPDFLVIL